MAGGMALEAGDLAAHADIGEILLDRALQQRRELADGVFRQVRPERRSPAASTGLPVIVGYDTRPRGWTRREGERKRMRVLVIGSGGREHALCWAIAASPLCDALYCAPGNPGIAEEAICVPSPPTISTASSPVAGARRIDFVVVGPEAPLVAGLVDRLEAAGHRRLRPQRRRRRARRLEGLHQGSLRQVRHPDRRLSPLRRCRRRPRPMCAGARRADRGQGRRARRRQGRHRRRRPSTRPDAAIDDALIGKALRRGRARSS